MNIFYSSYRYENKGYERPTHNNPNTHNMTQKTSIMIINN